MKEPKDFALKNWLCDHSIKGLIVHHYQTGVDTADTDWELIPSEGKSKRVNRHKVQSLVTLRPDWARIMTVTDEVRNEIEQYRKFAKREAKDLAEYKRLKKKFDSDSW